MRKTIMALATLAMAGNAAAASGEEQVPNRFAAELLDSHNRQRSDAGAQPLTWSHKLAAEARQWAEVLAREGRMRHASQAERGGAGENLWTGSAGQYSARTMVESFIAERRDFKAGTFPRVSLTGNWRDVGHYTQVVWKETREVGCAVVRNQRDDFLVCRYWPAGNIYGAEMR